MEKLESVQYSAALTVTGTWRGTSREKLYTELGWESLSTRRWSRRLTLFFKFVNNLIPEYTVDPIPPLHQSQYCLRDRDDIGRMRARTDKFKSSFIPIVYPSGISLTLSWDLHPQFLFKGKTIINSPSPSKICFRNLQSNRITLSQLRVGLSKLNFHKFKHNFRDRINPMCPSNDGIEDTEHCLLLCASLIFN